jgi:hypothetical protein
MYKKITEYKDIVSIPKNGLSVDHNAEFIKGLEYACQNNMPGDFFDIGAWTGTVSYFAAIFFKLNNIDKKIYLFDTFEGHPREHYTDKDSSWSFDTNEFKNVNIDSIVNMFKAIDYTNYEIVKGDIFLTLPKFKDHNICFASLDLNYYAPTKFALEFLQTNKFKGVIFEDDYNHIKGITDAFNESKFVQKSTVLSSIRGGFFNL